MKNSRQVNESSAARKALTRLMGKYEYGTEPKISKREYQKRKKAGFKKAARVGDDVFADAPGAGRNPLAQTFKREWRKDDVKESAKAVAKGLGALGAILAGGAVAGAASGATTTAKNILGGGSKGTKQRRKDSETTYGGGQGPGEVDGWPGTRRKRAMFESNELNEMRGIRPAAAIGGALLAKKLLGPKRKEEGSDVGNVARAALRGAIAVGGAIGGWKLGKAYKDYAAAEGKKKPAEKKPEEKKKEKKKSKSVPFASGTAAGGRPGGPHGKRGFYEHIEPQQ